MSENSYDEVPFQQRQRSAPFASKSIKAQKAPAEVNGSIRAGEGIESDHEWYRSLLVEALESTADGILVVSDNGTWTIFNQTFIDIWNIPAHICKSGNDGDALAHVCAKLVNPELFMAKVRELYQNKEATSLDTLELKDGRVLERYSQPQRLRDRVVGRVWRFRDITERKRTEAALRRSEEKYRRLFENSIVGFFQSTPEGRFHTVNPAFARMLGYQSPQDLIESISDITTQYYVDPRDRRRYQKILQQRGFVENCEFRVRLKSGAQMWVSNSTRAYFDNDGKVVCHEGVVIDITERKQAEKKLNEINTTLVERTKLAEQRAVSIQQLAMELSNAEDRERQRLASVLHDDFQQTLAYLKLKLNSLNLDDGIDDDLAALNDLIDGCIYRCRHLACELRPPVLQQKGFSGALRQLCRQMKEMYSLDVTLKTTPTTEIKSPVLSSMLIRSVRELLFNVVKHSGEKCALVEVRVNGDQALITVKDAGKGCDPGELKGKRDNAAGFGLFSIEDRVNFLGGYMQVDSKVDNGFCVTLWVPSDVSCPSNPPETDSIADRVVEPDPEAAENPATELVAGAPISVMLADDHELMREGLVKLLRGQDGIDVIGVAADGREAIQLATQLKPDVVLMDISMPVMGGIEATARISKSLPATRIIGLTMHKDPEIRQAMLDAGACACLSKAGSPEELVKRMRRAHHSANRHP